MDWLKRNPLLFFALLLGVAALAVEVHTLLHWQEQARRAAVGLQQRKQERDWLAGQSPALSEENVAAIATELATAERELAELRRQLAGRPGWLPAPPARPIDAYFALASFVEQMRAFAVRQQVALRPEERFGFATYANEGPEPDLIAAVHQQRVVVQHLLELLFEAQPRALVAVQRERPLTTAQREARRNPSASEGAAAPAPRGGGQAGDFFTPDARLLLPAEGWLENTGFRVEFTGQTQTLRAFLNSLAAYQLPLIVRSVEVEPLPPAAGGDEPPAPGAPVPLVASNFSKFAVTLECVAVLPAPVPASP